MKPERDQFGMPRGMVCHGEWCGVMGWHTHPEGGWWPTRLPWNRRLRAWLYRHGIKVWVVRYDPPGVGRPATRDQPAPPAVRMHGPDNGYARHDWCRADDCIGCGCTKETPCVSHSPARGYRDRFADIGVALR